MKAAGTRQVRIQTCKAEENANMAEATIWKIFAAVLTESVIDTYVCILCSAFATNNYIQVF